MQEPFCAMVCRPVRVHTLHDLPSITVIVGDQVAPVDRINTRFVPISDYIGRPFADWHDRGGNLRIHLACIESHESKA